MDNVYAKEFMEAPRLKRGDDGYVNVKWMLRLVQVGTLGRMDSDLLIMPTVNPVAPFADDKRLIASHGLTSACTCFTHRDDSPQKNLRERLQAHKLRALTVRDLMKAHRKAERLSIVEVYCIGFVFPFVWFMGMDQRPQKHWVEDLDTYCHTPRMLSFDNE